MKVAVVACLSFGLAGSAFGQCCAGKKAKTGAPDEGTKATARIGGEKDDKCAAACKDKGQGGADCPEKALQAAGAPLMRYKVGDQTTTCPKQAAEWMNNTDVKVRYVVGETEYADQAEGMRAYVAALKDYFETMTSVRYVVGDKCVSCPMAAQSIAKDTRQPVKFRVASFTFEDKAGAEKAATAAREAADNISMKVSHDDKHHASDQSGAGSAGKTCCAKKSDGGAGEATAKATCAGHPSGHEQGKSELAGGKQCGSMAADNTACCEAKARIDLAQARVIVAYKAVQQLAAGQTENKEVAAANSPGGS
jgi:hypothetical protein